MQQLISAWNTMLNVALYPSTWLHERTHEAVFKPYATDVDNDYGATQSDASVTVCVSGMPAWQYVLGALAPTIIGLLLAILGVVASLSTAYAPGSDAVKWLVIGAYWFTYTIPSAADVETATKGVVAQATDGVDDRGKVRNGLLAGLSVVRTAVREAAREDLQAARDADHVAGKTVLFVLELPATLAFTIRLPCYLAAGLVLETARRGEEPVFDESMAPHGSWSWTRPGFEHKHQSRWEIRLAGVFCVVAGIVLYQTLIWFPSSTLEMTLLYATCGALVLEPAWSEMYLQVTDREFTPGSPFRSPLHFVSLTATTNPLEYEHKTMNDNTDHTDSENSNHDYANGDELGDQPDDPNTVSSGGSSDDGIEESGNDSGAFGATSGGGR